MRVILLLAVTMTVAMVGCKKKAAPPADTRPAPGAPEPAAAPNPTPNSGGATPSGNPPPQYSSSFNSVTAPNQSGNLTVTGGQGAIQAPRMAAARTVNNVQLTQLHLSMFQTWQLDNRVPGRDEIIKEAQQNSQLFPLIRDEVIILTGTNRGDGVWAYTRYPQRANEHYVVMSQGVVQMAPEELRKRLEQQMSPIKMDK